MLASRAARWRGGLAAAAFFVGMTSGVQAAPAVDAPPQLTQQVAIVAPQFSFSKCPGGSAAVSFAGFPPGSYTLSSAYATFVPTSTTVDASGAASHVDATVADDAPATFSAYATPDGSQTPASTATITLPSLHVFGYEYYDKYPISGWCFRPGAALALSASAGVRLPTDAVADGYGQVDFDVRVHALPAPSTATVQLTDASGRSASLDLAVPGTTLRAGDEIDDAGAVPTEIYSPAMHYEFFEAGCTVWVRHHYTSGGQHYSPTIWWAGTGGFVRAGCHFAVQHNGNLVLYTHRGKVLWDAGTQRTGTANRLAMQDDGNLVLRTAAGKIVWSSKRGRTTLLPGASLLRGQSLQTEYFGEAKLVLQDNGNLVYQQYGKPVWTSQTAGSGAARLIMQRDGNLVLRRSDGTRLWSSGTTGTGERLVVRRTGLVILDAAGRRVWHVG